MVLQPAIWPSFRWRLGKLDSDCQEKPLHHSCIAKLIVDVLRTFLTQTEMTLKSRSLTLVTAYPENGEPLTINHFCHSTTIQQPSTRGIQQLDQRSLDDDHLWKRLKKEYLPSLMKRPKWNEMQPPMKVAHILWLLKDITPRLYVFEFFATPFATGIVKRLLDVGRQC